MRTSPVWFRLSSMAALYCLASRLALAVPAPVASSLADMSLEELGSIEITSASRRAEPLSDVATALFVITSDDIRRSGASTLAEALRLAPNLHVALINNNNYSISARGFSGTSSNKLLVLIDGRSVYTPLFAGVFWDVQNVLLGDVERIEVISGPGSTLWGANAVNGVINVITRSAKRTQGWLAEGTAGTQHNEAAVRYGGSTTSATAGASDTDAMHYRLYARHANDHHTQLANGDDVDDAGQISEMGFRADWASGHDQLMVESQLYRGAHGQPKGDGLTNGSVPLESVGISGAHLLGRWMRQMEGLGELSVQSYVDHTERTSFPKFAEKLDVTDLQVQYAAPKTGQQAWIVGGALRFAQDRVTNSNFLSFMPADVNQTWSSLFVQDDITLHSDVKLSLGTRLESNDYTGLEWLPNARLAWKLAPEHLIWTALSRTVRAPSRLDVDFYIPSGVANPPWLLAGGPGFDSEIARVFEVGYRGQPTANTSLSLNWYRSLYDNLRTLELQQVTGFIPTYVISGRMRAAINGLEAWGSYQPLPFWRLSAGLNGLYQRFALSSDSTDTFDLAAAKGQDPALTWQLRSSWDLPQGHEFDVIMRHVSALPSLDIPSYLAMDLRWGWRPQSKLELSLTARNILGSGHAEYASMGSSSLATRSEISPGLAMKVLLWF